jgi:hypothetical protein
MLIMSFVTDILGTAKDNIKGGVANAGARLLSGDVNGALSTLTDIPGNLLANAGARGSASFGDGFAGINARQDAVQDWCWYCIMPRIGGKDLPWYYVTGANTPFRKFHVETLKRNGREAHYPESYAMSSSLQLKFFVDSSSKSSQYLKAWQAEILGDANPALAANQGVWGYPAKYKKTITIAVLSVDRKELLVFKYFGCFVSDPQALDLGAGSSNPMELTVEFQIEDVDLTVKNGLGIIDNLKEQAKGLAMDFISGGVSSIVSNFSSVPSALQFKSGSNPAAALSAGESYI